MNVHRALSELAEIRAQLDRTANYQGFRSLTVGVSAVFCLVGAILQTLLISNPNLEVDAYLTIWLSVALCSSVLAGIEMAVRGWISNCDTVWRMHQKLISQLLPSLMVGSVMTLVIANHSISVGSDDGMMWLLPGAWAMLFGLGIYSCRERLPKPAIFVAAYYLLGGMMMAILNSKTHAMDAWQMVILFGFGQTLLGGILYWSMEQKNG